MMERGLMAFGIEVAGDEGDGVKVGGEKGIGGRARLVGEVGAGEAERAG